MQSAEPHASYKAEPAYGYNEVQGNLPQHNQGAYTPAPYNQGHYVQHSRPEVPFKRGWHITKIVLLSFSLIFSVVVIAVTASGAAHSMPRRAGLLMLCTVPQAGAAALWDLAEFVTICARGGKKGITPGARVGMHLVLWLGFGAAIGLGVVVLLLDNYLDHLVYYDYDYDSYLAAHRTYNIAIALDALLLAVHFILFVGACVDTAQRNALRSVYIVNTNVGYAQPQMTQQSAPMPVQG